MGEYPLETAARMLRHNLCEQLLKLGANVNFVDASGNSPIHSVIDAFAENPHEPEAIAALKIVQLLLSHGANANLRAYNDFTPLHLACARGATEIVKRLLEKGADPKLVAEEWLEGGRTPIEIARLYDRQDIIKLLLAVIPTSHLAARESKIRKLRNHQF